MATCDMDPFPKALDELMVVRGIDQRELAARADINQGTVSRYLDGLRVPTPPTMERIAAVLEVKPEEVFREYRQWKAKHLVEEAMAAGLIDLEDIELILAGKRIETDRRQTGRLNRDPEPTGFAECTETEG